MNTSDTTEEFSDRGSVHIDETVDGLTLGQISNDVLNIVLTLLQVTEE